jgi:hypothetical protein
MMGLNAVKSGSLWSREPSSLCSDAISASRRTCASSAGGFPTRMQAQGKFADWRGHNAETPPTEAKTDGDGLVLRPGCDQHELRSIVFVAAKDHSRRIRRVLNRVMKGHPTRVTVQPARYSSFDPDRWWEIRSVIRTEIVELRSSSPMSFCSQPHFKADGRRVPMDVVAPAAFDGLK